MTDMGGVGRFATPLRVEIMPPGRFARALEPFIYVGSDGHHWLTPAGFVFDGASIPQLLWSRFGGPFDGPNIFIGAVHDPRYRFADCDRETADHLLLDVGRCAGLSDDDARAIYLGVRLGGEIAWIDNARKRRECGADQARLLAWAA